jgi:hypothetical protein
VLCGNGRGLDDIIAHAIIDGLRVVLGVVVDGERQTKQASRGARDAAVIYAHDVCGIDEVFGEWTILRARSEWED